MTGCSVHPELAADRLIGEPAGQRPDVGIAGAQPLQAAAAALARHRELECHELKPAPPDQPQDLCAGVRDVRDQNAHGAIPP